MNKDKIARLTAKKFARIIKKQHVMSVVKIFFEEMAVDINNFKPIKIKNFGDLDFVFTKGKSPNAKKKLNVCFKIKNKLCEKILKNLKLEESL